MKHKHPLSHYARIYKKSERTLGNYSRAGINLDNPEEVSLHKACLRNSGAKRKKSPPLGDGPGVKEREALANVEQSVVDLDTFTSSVWLAAVRSGLREELTAWHGELLGTFARYPEIMDRHGLDGIFTWEDGEAVYIPAAELPD